MNYSDKIDTAAAARIAALLQLPAPTKEDVGAQGFFDPWDAFDGIMGAYDSEIDELAVKTLEAVRDRTTFELMKGQHHLFVQFFLHVLAGHHYVDYGTSPRGAFPTWGYTSDLWQAWIDKWKAWYVVNWEEEFPN